MTLSYCDEAIEIKRLAPLTDRDIARATGAGVSTVGAWLRRTNAPTGERAERLVELAWIVEYATRVLKRDYIPVWLNKPVPILDREKPIDVIARGEYRRIADILASLESPTFT
jgi:putative toxin-antitoxin system antitoxin component (TIGR02293 family)